MNSSGYTSIDSFCPKCGAKGWYIPVDLNKSVTQWCGNCNENYVCTHHMLPPVATQQPSDADSYSFHGRTGSPLASLNRSTQILDLFDQITALRQKFYGISCFHSNPLRSLEEELVGKRITKQTEEEKLEDSISASFVKLQQELFNLFTHAKIAESNMIHSPLGADSSTTTSGQTPTDSR